MKITKSQLLEHMTRLSIILSAYWIFDKKRKSIYNYIKKKKNSYCLFSEINVQIPQQENIHIHTWHSTPMHVKQLHLG